jgi:FkbM family methyltransferase
MVRSFKEILRKLSRLVGRKNLYRASHFLIRAARGEVTNSYESNGERMAQTVALHTAAPPAVILDVGANIGDWTAGLLEISGHLHIPAHVHAFEPSRGTFSRLSARHGNSPDVTLVNEACSRNAGTAIMHVFEGDEWTNSLADPHDGRKSVSEEVRLTTVDNYCKAASIERIDLLKIDAEGHDFEVIAGASGMLDRGAVRILQFEYNYRWIGARNYLKDVFSFLTPRGYAIGKLTGSSVEFYPFWHWELETWDEGNYIACPLSEVGQFQCSKPSWLSFKADSGQRPAE